MGTILLKEDFNIVKAETEEYILRTPYKSYYIPEIFFSIISLLREGASVEDVVNELEGKVNIGELNKIIKSSFMRMGIICGTSYDRTKTKRMLWYKKDICSPAFLYNEKMLSVIANKYFVITSLLIYLLVYILGIGFWGGLKELNEISMTFDQGIIVAIYVILLYVSTMVHELGHYLMCLWVGGKPGKIGIGVYLVIPVLYANLDDLWRLSYKKRNIVNLAGVYFQSLFLLFYALLAVVFQQKIPFIICFAGSLSALLNFFPFLKFDGYWIITDFLETENLMSKSLGYLKSILKFDINQIYYRSAVLFKQTVFKIYSIMFGIFLLVYAYIFFENFKISLSILYNLIIYQQLESNIIVLLIRSGFIILTSIKVVTILLKIKKR